jgi:hypothetical protein
LLAILSAHSYGRLPLQRQWRVIQQPLQADQADKVAKSLRTLRNLAATKLADATKIDCIEDNVRANVFLVDYRRAQEGVGFKLHMPIQLRVAMDNPIETELTLAPDLGATGTAFTSGQAVLTVDRPFGTPQRYHCVYEDIIHKDLKGIISVPILDDRHANVVAVVNVDVTEKDIEDSHLDQVYQSICSSKELRTFSKRLNRFKKARVTVGIAHSLNPSSWRKQ